MSRSPREVVVCAPMDGRVVPLQGVPDPAFAQGLVGAGVAIDPVGELVVAPCAGVLRRSGHAHAFTVETEAGDVLVHVGIDTVALAGEGFTVLREDGSRVDAGDEILRLDLDHLAHRAPSLVSPVLALGVAERSLTDLCHTGIVRRGAPLYRMTVAAESAAATGSAELQVRRARVRGEHGLHARPAAELVGILRGLRADVWVSVHGKRADARSITALMALGTAQGDEVLLEAAGDDAGVALDALSACFDPPVSKCETPRAVAELPGQLAALVAVRGVAAGPACRWVAHQWSFPLASGDYTAEIRRLDEALAAVTLQLAGEAQPLKGARRDILEAHAAMLADPALRESAVGRVRLGDGAARAWATACESMASRLRQSPDRRMAERAADLADVSQRVLVHLLGAPPVTAIPDGSIVVADELLPSQLLALDPARVGAVVTARGGTTAHAAILAAGLGLPMLVAAGETLLAVPDGEWLIVDAEQGHVEVGPTDERRREFASVCALREERLRAARAAVHAPVTLADGESVCVECNLGRATEAKAAAAGGAEGVGLLRTEFLFLERTSAPDTSEQQAEYAAVTEAFAGRPVTIRILDAGGDKPLPFVSLPREDNPALGLRGLRTGLAYPELLSNQLKALAATPGEVRVLLPMVNDVTELRQVRAMLAEAGRTLPLGVMIETPASVLLADSLAAEADFFSIGSNDLAQYVLAIDRLHPTLGSSLDGLHPAVLRAMQTASLAARRAGKPVAVCGGLAADPDAIPLLVGMGIRELSVAAAAVAEVKAAVRGLDPLACAQLLADAAHAPDAATVRARVREFRALFDEVSA